MEEIKILIDENIGKPITKAIASLLLYHFSKPIIKHIQDFYEEGITDDIWIPQIALEKWIIVTADRAKKYGGAKLPSICKKFNVNHILISGRLHNEKQFEKARAIITVWPQILTIPDEPAGTRFALRFTSLKSITLEKR